MCQTIGSAKEANLRPLPEAVKVVEDLIKEHIGFCKHDIHPAPMKKVVAVFLIAWQQSAKDPDDIVCGWLTNGAPFGINQQLVDPSTFAECATPADLQPCDLHCDAQTSRTYIGVEEAEITETELSAM